MKILKRVLLALAAIIVLVLVTALFVKQDMSAEKEIVINKPKSEVFSYVKNLRNQNSYSKWGSMDPAMKTEYKGEDGAVGFVYAWKSEKDDVGSGEQEIKGIKEGERIDYEIRFLEPMESTATSYMTTEAIADNQTKVKWGFKGKMNYPFNVMRLFMDMEGMIGEDFATGLSNLKTQLEK